MAAEPRTKAASNEPSANGRSACAPDGMTCNGAARPAIRSSESDATGMAARGLHSIVTTFEGRLIRYAARITGDLERGRDVAQETFLRLCRDPAMSTSDDLAQWLFTVCRRLAIDVQRKETRMNTGDVAGVCELPLTTAEPAHVEQAEEAKEALRLLGGLPANQQEVVRLKFQEGMSYKAIAAITGLSVSNVGYLLHTAVATLRKKMDATK